MVNHHSRAQKGKKGAYIGIIGNIILFIIKLPLGILGGSYALVAASLHTLSDAMSSLVVLIGFHALSKPADEKHQYGHGDAEAISGLIVAILVTLIGFEVGRESIFKLLGPIPKSPGPLAVIGALISIAGNWYMTVKEATIGKEIRSPSLLADSEHHASDALSSGLVLIGIIGAMAGYPRLDPVAGLAVSLFIIKTGFDVGRENIDMLMGRVSDMGLIEEIQRIATGIDGVLGIHNIKAHYIGVAANVQLHIDVDKDMKVIDADRLAHRVQAALVSKLEDVTTVTVHTCPCKNKGEK